jgi:hypothetical protein
LAALWRSPVRVPPAAGRWCGGLATRWVRWGERRWTGGRCIGRREGRARSRRHHSGDRIPFGVHTLDIGHVILGLARRGSDLLLRIGSAPVVLSLEDVHRLANCREREHAGSSRDTGTGTEEAHPEEQSPPFHRHSVSPVCAVGEVRVHRPAPTNPNSRKIQSHNVNITKLTRSCVTPLFTYPRSYRLIKHCYCIKFLDTSPPHIHTVS